MYTVEFTIRVDRMPYAEATNVMDALLSAADAWSEAHKEYDADVTIAYVIKEAEDGQEATN